MSDDREVVNVVREWVSKAEGDLCAATHLLDGNGAPWIVAFHAQQSAEKYLKALLVSFGTPFQKGHDIGELITLLPESSRPAIGPEAAFDLTQHAVASRYPEAREPTVEEAREALGSARQVRDFVRAHLPPTALPHA